MGPLRVVVFLESCWSGLCMTLSCTSKIEWTSALYPGFFASLWPHVFYLELPLLVLWCLIMLQSVWKAATDRFTAKIIRHTWKKKSKTNHRCVFIRISVIYSKCPSLNWSSQSNMICHCECFWNICSYSTFPNLMAVSGRAWINQAHVSTDSNGSLSALKCASLPFLNSFNR